VTLTFDLLTLSGPFVPVCSHIGPVENIIPPSVETGGSITIQKTYSTKEVDNDASTRPTNATLALCDLDL